MTMRHVVAVCDPCTSVFFYPVNALVCLSDLGSSHVCCTVAVAIVLSDSHIRRRRRGTLTMIDIIKLNSLQCRGGSW